MYNIFPSSGGPELYGTEPWTFYFKNLLLNFNIWFVLALLTGPLFVLQKLFARSNQGFVTAFRTFIFMSPFYMWLAIFSLQPHKEERFMYPAYPLLVLNAALSGHMLLVFIGQSSPQTLMGKIPAKIKLFFVGVTFLLSVDIGLSRIYGLYSAYHAPLSIYSPLWDTETGGLGNQVSGENVCFGKEWYRFPSSYFLPKDMHAKWIRSEFRGLLPGEFQEARTGFGFWGGTWLETSGLNDRNEEDDSKYVNVRMCQFLVDTQYPESRDELPPREPDYIAETQTWEEVKCVPFLDATRTHTLARTLWVPEMDFVPDEYRRKWGRHCLLRRRTGQYSEDKVA